MENLKIHDLIELKNDASDPINWDCVRNNVLVHENDRSDFVTYSVSGVDFFSVGNLDQSSNYVRQNRPPPFEQKIRFLRQLETQNMFLIVCDRDIAIYDYAMDTVESFATDFQWIRLCALSPLEDYLFVIDEEPNGSVSISVLLTSNFCVAHKRNLLEDDDQFPNLSKVGWGSDKTQFKGMKKKSDRDPVVEYEKDTEYYCDWSPDNKLVAVSYWSNARRVVKVYDKELQPVSVCERVGGLYGPIKWRYDSHFLYAVQRRTENVEDFGHTHLITFERNGLRFASVSLLAKFSMHVTRLLWHPELNLLLVVYERPEKVGRSYLHFWMLKNSFWYLKKSMKFENLVYVSWLSGNQLMSLSVLTESRHTRFRLKLVMDCTIAESAHHLSTVCFANGRRLHLTNFRDVAIPLPASQYSIQFRKIIESVTVSRLRNLIAVVLSGKKPEALIYEWSETEKCYSQTHSLQFDKHNSEKSDAFRDCVMFSADDPHRWEPHLIIETHATLDSRFLSFQKQAYRFKKIEWKLEGLNMVFFQDFENQLFVADSRKREADADFLIERNVRNFAFGNNYLLIITSSNELKMIHLQELCSKMKQNKSCESSNCKTLQKRPLEAGSDLVTTNAHQAKLVLQMPRGNIETIFPRPLLIEKIDVDLRERRYANAYNLADKNQVNMNVLHDLCPKDWIEHVDDFVAAIYEDAVAGDAFETNSKLIKFLLQLENRNVLRDLYDGSSRWNSEINDIDSAISEDFENKIEHNVLTFLRAIMDRANSDCFAATAVVAHLVNAKATANADKADYEILDALKILDQNRKTGAQNSHFSNEHLLRMAANLIPIEKLLKCCLRHNYLELALFVVSNSDLDPKSIVPFVRQMQTIDDHDRRLYEIRNYLKERAHALEYLVRFGAFEEILEYVRKHELYEKGIELCTAGETRFRDEHNLKQICGMCADYFANKNLWRKAAAVFEIGRFYERAIEMFLKINDSKTLMNCVRLFKVMRLSDDELRTRVRQILTGPLMSVDFRSIAYLYSEVLEDYKSAILSYVKGEFYEEAHLMAIVKNRTDLIDDTLRPELISAVENCLKSFEYCSEQLQTRSDRLSEIRKLRSATILGHSEAFNGHFFNMQFERNDDDSSSLITSSTSSFCSGTGTASETGTGTTSRQKRRQKKIDKKLEVIKEGAELEDAAIIKYLHRLITSVYREEKKVARIEHTLREIGEHQMAEQLNSSHASLLALIASRVSVIWPDDVTQFQVECKHNEVGVCALLRNFRHLDVQYRFPPTK